MSRISKRKILNLLGGTLVLFWVVMVGVLIQKTHFGGARASEGTDFVASVPQETERDWMEIFLKGNKVGYSMSQRGPLGQDILIQDEIVLHLHLMGQPTAMRTSTRAVVDTSFYMKEFLILMRSGVVNFRASGKVMDGNLHLQVGEGASKTSQVIPLSERPVIGSAMAHYFKGRTLTPGDSFRFSLFDPSLMAQKETVIHVKDRETITIQRQRYPVFRLETTLWGQTLTFWVDEQGRVLKEEGFMGLTLVRSNAASAPRNLAGGATSDLYEMAAVPVDRKIRDPEKITYLKLRWKGVEEEHFDTSILNKGRQRFSGDVLEVFQESLPGGLVCEDQGPCLPVPEDIKPLLEPELTIQSHDPALVDKALDITAGLRDPVAMVRTTMSWVYDNLEKRPVVSVPSALDVLESMVGDCTEHAVLLTALLRAVGIPSRVCVGLVYSNDRFFYHAWNEVYLGEWISMDATLNQVPTDATHIKLAEGGLESQASILALIGKLQLEVLAWRHD